MRVATAAGSGSVPVGSPPAQPPRGSQEAFPSGGSPREIGCAALLTARPLGSAWCRARLRPQGGLNDPGLADLPRAVSALILGILCTI